MKWESLKNVSCSDGDIALQGIRMNSFYTFSIQFTCPPTCNTATFKEMNTQDVGFKKIFINEHKSTFFLPLSSIKETRVVYSMKQSRKWLLLRLNVLWWQSILRSALASVATSQNHAQFWQSPPLAPWPVQCVDHSRHCNRSFLYFCLSKKYTLRTQQQMVEARANRVQDFRFHGKLRQDLWLPQLTLFSSFTTLCILG